MFVLSVSWGMPQNVKEQQKTCAVNCERKLNLITSLRRQEISSGGRQGVTTHQTMGNFASAPDSHLVGQSCFEAHEGPYAGAYQWSVLGPFRGLEVKCNASRRKGGQP